MLALARAPDSALWVGTYGHGIYVWRPGAAAWEHHASSRDTAAHAISFDFVHAFAFGPRGEIWYGTVGNGWGLSTDGGRTWRNWEIGALGPEWQYVTPNGIVTRGDTTYIATADGIKVTTDDGARWAVITDPAGVATAQDSVLGRITNQYVLAIALGEQPGELWIGTLAGLAGSRDGGRSWHAVAPPCPSCTARVRALLATAGNVWVGTERGLEILDPAGERWSTIAHEPRNCSDSVAGSLPCSRVWPGVQRLARDGGGPILASSGGLVAAIAPEAATWRMLRRGAGPAAMATAAIQWNQDSVVLGSMTGLETAPLILGRWIEEHANPVRTPARPQAHTWFSRPIAPGDQPFIDQTYRFGSTMGGYFQPHQGVEFNNPDGTPVHAIGDGEVVHAGPAEQGALTVAIRHRRMYALSEGNQALYSVYYHNSKLLVTVGQHVRAGEVIALAGNTGRATNDHLHLEVHVLPRDSVRLVVDPDVRYPPYNANPELWIEPLPGTGIVAGQVWDSKREPVPQARIYGLVKPEPQETPFSFIETYGPRNHPDPAYDEHFAISDVPPGEYTLGVEIEGRKVWRRIRVEAGKLTWVEFRPDARR